MVVAVLRRNVRRARAFTVRKLHPLTTAYVKVVVYLKNVSRDFFIEYGNNERQKQQQQFPIGNEGRGAEHRRNINEIFHW